jgi:2-haloacid dehalogenase
MQSAAHSSAASPSHNLLDRLDPNQPARPQYSNPHSACGTALRSLKRGFLPWRLSDAGRSCPWLRSSAAGIRNPSQKRNSVPSATFSLMIRFDGVEMSKDARTAFEIYKPTTLTFDCYGTLIDWERGACRALRDIYGYSQSRVTDADLIDLFLQSDARMIRENIFPYSKVLRRIAQSVAKSLGIMSDPGLEVLFARSLPSWPPFEETNACLTWFARRYRLAIISNIDDRLLSQTIEQFAVQFDVLVTSEQSKSYKPNLPIFERAVELIGEHPSKIIHIAEGRCEAIPVRALGMQSIWVNRSPRSDDGSKVQPHAVVSNLTEIVEAIS